MVLGIAIGSICAIAGAAFGYGYWRKFTKVTYMGYQIALLFALTFALRFLPSVGSDTILYCIVVAAVFVAMLGVFGIFGLIRRRVTKDDPATKRGEIGLRVAGGFTAIVNIFVLLAVVVGTALAVLY